MERILSIEIEHFKNHYAGHLAAALLLSLLAPVIMGMEALNQYQAGQILDVYFSLLGIVLLTPLFMPEQGYPGSAGEQGVSAEKHPASAPAAGSCHSGSAEPAGLISDETGGVHLSFWNLFLVRHGELSFSGGPWHLRLRDHGPSGDCLYDTGILLYLLLRRRTEISGQILSVLSHDR